MIAKLGRILPRECGRVVQRISSMRGAQAPKQSHGLFRCARNDGVYHRSRAAIQVKPDLPNIVTMAAISAAVPRFQIRIMMVASN